MDTTSLSVKVWNSGAVIGESNSTNEQIYDGPCRLKAVHVVGVPLAEAPTSERAGYVLLFDQAQVLTFDDADIKMRMRYGAGIGRVRDNNYLEFVLPGTGLRFDSGLLAVGRRDTGPPAEANAATMLTGNLMFFFAPGG